MIMTLFWILIAAFLIFCLASVIKFAAKIFLKIGIVVFIIAVILQAVRII